MRETPERVRLGRFASSFFEEAPISIIEIFYTCFGRPALVEGLGKIGVSADGDILAKMQILLKSAKAGDLNSERMLRTAMRQAALDYAGRIEPIEVLQGITAVFREVQVRKYVLDDGFDPRTIFDLDAFLQRAIARAS